MPKKKDNLSPEERLAKAVIPKEEEPYKLPDNWVWTRLGDITESFDKKRRPVSLAERSKIENPKIYPYYGATGIIDYVDEYIFEGRYILLGEDGANLLSRSKENAFIVEGKFWVNNHAHILKNRDIILDKFFVYFYNNLDLSEYVTGSAQPKLNAVNLSKIKFILLPLEEQKRIVEKLDSLFEKTGKIKEIIEEVKNKTSLRREAVLSKAFTGELTEKWRAENKTENAKELLLKINEEKLKNNPKVKIKDISEMLVNEDEIPYKVPENWVWTRLGDIFRVERGGSPRPIKDFLVDNIDGINWIKIGDTELGKKYINSTKEKIKKEGIKKSRYVKKGDLLLTNSMSFGRAYILNCDGCIHDGWLVLQPEFDKISREYFYYLLNSRYMYLVFSELAKGSTVKNLNKDIVKTVAISLPPLEEQKEIVRILDKVFEEENKISELISLEEKVEILEKTILDKAFRGELGTGNADDEPAIELLKRAVEENE